MSPWRRGWYIVTALLAGYACYQTCLWFVYGGAPDIFYRVAMLVWSVDLLIMALEQAVKAVGFKVAPSRVIE